MRVQGRFGYEHRGYHEITIPYVGGELLFVILLPDEKSDLRTLEKTMTSDLLASAVNAKPRELIIELPKLKLEPPVMALKQILQELGMQTAFNPGRANFERMSPLDAPGGPLSISAVFHKTFLALDEKGTEAAAATAVSVSVTNVGPTPDVIKIDRPFLFAIQDRESGACLFLGRVTDPR
jgi:serine protease inhibitor